METARGIGHGDPTSRLMRGWAAQLVSVAVSLVVTNARLASNAVFRPFKSPEYTPPSTPPAKGRKASERMGTDSPNAPPMAAQNTVKTTELLPIEAREVSGLQVVAESGKMVSARETSRQLECKRHENTSARMRI
jgi:hypothetical protein